MQVEHKIHENWLHLWVGHTVGVEEVSLILAGEVQQRLNDCET